LAPGNPRRSEFTTTDDGKSGVGTKKEEPATPGFFPFATRETVSPGNGKHFMDKKTTGKTGKTGSIACLSLHSEGGERVKRLNQGSPKEAERGKRIRMGKKVCFSKRERLGGTPCPKRAELTQTKRRKTRTKRRGQAGEA